MEDRTSEEQLFYAAFISASVGIVITDLLLPDQPIIYCNPAFEKITGYNKSEIIGRNCRFLQGDDRDQPALHTLRSAISQGKPCTTEIRNYKKDGTLFWNELKISPVHHPIDHRLQYLIGFQNDVTRRRNAEQVLNWERQNLEQAVEARTRSVIDKEIFQASIIETVRESLMVLDESIRILSVNRHFCQFFEVTPEEVIGRSLYDLGNGQWDNHQLRELLERILPTNNPLEGFRVEHDFPNIGHKIMLLNARQITYEGEFRNTILLAMEDITALAEVDRRKDDFINIASHEMRGPLTTIKGYLQLLKQQVDEGNISQFGDSLNKILSHTERLQDVMTRLLDISTLNEGRPQPAQ